MTQIVIKKNKYLIGIFIILLSGVVIFLNSKKAEETVYVLYTGKPSNCFNVEEYDKEKYFVFCKEKTSIFFKIEKKQKTINSSKINIISEELLFKRFGEFGSGKNIDFFIVLEKSKSKESKVFKVKKAEFWY